MSLPVTSLTDIQKECSPAKIVAVSKLQSEEKIRELYRQGQRDFGENYVQELTKKIENLKDLKDIRWHFIGHLQRNKVKAVVGNVELIHSLDSIELAEEIDKQAEKNLRSQKVLIEINLANEESKGGFSKEQATMFWSLLCKFPHLHVVGVMTMPPLSPDPELARSYFRELKNLVMTLKTTTPPEHPPLELSMGTSGDYRVAIQEGATIVRLGTILFGERATKS